MRRRDVALARISAEVFLLEYHLSFLLLCEERMMWRSWMLQYHTCTADRPDGKTTGISGMDGAAGLSCLPVKGKRIKNSCTF